LDGGSPVAAARQTIAFGRVIIGPDAFDECALAGDVFAQIAWRIGSNSDRLVQCDEITEKHGQATARTPMPRSEAGISPRFRDKAPIRAAE